MLIVRSRCWQRPRRRRISSQVYLNWQCWSLSRRFIQKDWKCLDLWEICHYILWHMITLSISMGSRELLRANVNKCLIVYYRIRIIEELRDLKICLDLVMLWNLMNWNSISLYSNTLILCKEIIEEIFVNVFIGEVERLLLRISWKKL